MASRDPLIAITLLFLPMLYLGSYLALVDPKSSGVWNVSGGGITPLWSNYRFGDPYSRRIFWPLEQIDRRLRPDAWPDSTILQAHYAVDPKDFEVQTGPKSE